MSKVYDVIVIGGGPAGMAAALNAGAEGLPTLLIEGFPVVGGRCAPSHAIENLLGHLSISGQELADIGHAQLDKFGVDTLKGFDVVKLAHFSTDELVGVQLSNGGLQLGGEVVIAAGMKPKLPTLPGASLFNVYGCAEPSMVEQFKHRYVVVIGGENSATQAALNFANHGANTTLLVKPGVEWKMSAYLHPILLSHPNITVVEGEPVRLEGEGGRVTEVCLANSKLKADAVLVFNGAVPNTSWLPAQIDVDSKGFIRTDFRMRTSMPQVWAVGDIRSGSVKRVGAAIGEGTSVVRYIMMEERNQ